MKWVEDWPPSYTRSWGGVVERVEVRCHLDHDGLGVEGYHLSGSHGSEKHLSSSSDSLSHLPCSFPSFCGLGIFFLTMAVIRERPIIFFFLLVSEHYEALLDT